MATQTQINEFVQRFYPVAQQLEQKYGMQAWASLSQWAHETDYGTSPMFKEKNNIAGIGAFDSDPSKALTFSTPEEAADYAVRVQMAKAQKPENQWMNKRYAPSAAVLADKSNPPQSTFSAMQDSKWATDPDYASKLMTRYNQIKPLLDTYQPNVGMGTERSVEKPAKIYSPRQTSNYNPQQDQQWQQQADQSYAGSMNKSVAMAPGNQPGYIAPQGPPQSVDFNKIGNTLGSWFNSIIGKGG